MILITYAIVFNACDINYQFKLSDSEGFTFIKIIDIDNVISKERLFFVVCNSKNGKVTTFMLIWLDFWYYS